MNNPPFITIIFFAGLIMFSGCIGDSNVDSLIEDLDYENESIRSNAIDELVDMEDEKTNSLLMQVVQNENNTIEMRKNAITALGKTGDNSTTDFLLNISMNESENQHLRMASILALGDISDEGVLPSLSGLSHGEDGLILYHAAYVTNQLNESYKFYETYEVYGTYGKLPYPLTEEQRNFRNNVYEIRSSRPCDICNITGSAYCSVSQNSRSGYIEIGIDANPGTSAMDEVYQFYNSEAEKRGVYQVPVRFIHSDPFVFPVFYYEVDKSSLN
jgi:HEAT repeat protein